MKEITKSQFAAIKNLWKCSLISSITIDLGENGLSRVTIKSTANADWNGVDAALDAALSKQFPDYEYMGTPARYTCPIDKAEKELYFINWEGETLFYLIMDLGLSNKEGAEHNGQAI